MSYFSEALRGTLNRLEIPAYRFAKESGIANSTINLYLSGKAAPSAGKLAALLNTLPSSEHSGLLIARLLDDIPEGWHDSVVILEKAKGGEKAGPRLPTGLSQELARALEFLSNQSIKSKEVRELVIDLARALGINMENEEK